MKLLFAIFALLLVQNAYPAEANDPIVVPYTDILSMMPVDRGDKIFVQLLVSKPVGNWPEKTPKDAAGKKPKLQLTFSSGFMRITFAAGLWSSTNTTILMRFAGGWEVALAHRNTLIEQWKNSNRPP